jgi:hypothetical protein
MLYLYFVSATAGSHLQVCSTPAAGVCLCAADAVSVLMQQGGFTLKTLDPCLQVCVRAADAVSVLCVSRAGSRAQGVNLDKITCGSLRINAATAFKGTLSL